jgi:hypothetical protein
VDGGCSCPSLCCLDYLARDGILRHQFDKRLKSFAPCYSQSLLVADFTENHSGLKIEKKNHKTRKLESIHEQHFVEWKNEDRKPDKKSSLRSLEFMSLEPEKFRLATNHQVLITHRVRSIFLFSFETGK